MIQFSQKKIRMNYIKKLFSNYTFEYQFKKYGILVSEVRVSQLVLPNGGEFILLTDTGRFNNLASFSEEIATRLQQRLNVDPLQTEWGEHYQSHKDRIDIVNYKWDYTKNRYTNPIWTKAPTWMSNYILNYIDDTNIFNIYLN
jgi:hypothetical protein